MYSHSSTEVGVLVHILQMEKWRLSLKQLVTGSVGTWIQRRDSDSKACAFASVTSGRTKLWGQPTWVQVLLLCCLLTAQLWAGYLLFWPQCLYL